MFFLAELHSLYVSRLEALGVSKQVNRTRFKLSLPENFPEAQEQTQGKKVVIVFKKVIQSMLKEAVQLQRDFTDDAKILAKASAKIRKDMLGFKGFTFSGRFGEQCQKKSVPTSLKFLISMIANGVNIENSSQDSQTCLSVCQTIFLTQRQTHHVKARKPPLPLFIGFNMP